MGLVQAKCTNCGAILSVDREKDAALCPYCGVPYIVEKAINNYSVFNKINAQNVYIQGNVEREFQIEGGVLVQYHGTDINVKLPEGILKIGNDAFAGTMIRSVSMCDDVLEIGDRAFFGCKNLQEVKWSPNIIHIGESSFAYCENLKTICLNSLRSIGEHAFRECAGVEKLEVTAEFVECGLLLGKSYEHGQEYWKTEESHSVESILEDIEAALHDEDFCRNDEELIQYLKAEAKELKNKKIVEFPKLFDIYIDGELLMEADERLLQFPYAMVAVSYIEKEISIQNRNLQDGIRQEQGVCRYCGGEFKGFFTKVCVKCGKKKDY